MTEPKFTPGPWGRDNNLGCKSIYSDKLDSDSEEGFGWEIAYTAGLANEDEDAANADLMAAAPEMYAALKAVEWVYFGTMPGNGVIAPSRCVSCGQSSDSGHAEDCPWLKVMRKAEGKND